MKIRIMLLICIPILIGLLLIGGCATTGKIKGPAKPESTLLIGRIQMTCDDFPKEWHINGEHTRNLRVYLVDPSIKKITKVKSQGEDGLFYLIDPAASQYVIVGFEIIKKSGNMTFKSSYIVKDTYIVIKKNSVNNLGDIIWTEKFEEQNKRGGGSSNFTKIGNHVFKRNYDEVERWFKNTYAESAWNSKNWIDVEYKNYLK